MEPLESSPVMDERMENDGTAGSEAPLDNSEDPGEGDPAQTPAQEEQSFRGMGLRVGVFVVILTVALLGMYKLGQKPRAEAKAELAQSLQLQMAPPPVNVVRPTLAPGETTLVLPGQTAAWYSTTVFARVSGYLHAWEHDIGDRVKKDELLATIDTPELDQQLKEAKAKVTALASDVKVAKDQLAFAKITAERFNSAAPNGAVSQQERDAKDAEYKTAQSKYEAAEAQLALGQATVGRLEAFEKFKEVRAPFDGVVTRRDVDIGSLVTAGSTANTTPMFVVDQVDKIRVYVKVPQSAVRDISEGLDAQVTSPEYPDQAFTGKVARTAGAVDPVSRTMKVEVDVPNPKLLLTAGMYVQVGFQTSREHPPLVIEAGAMQLRPEGPTVAVVGPHGHVHFQRIRIARDMGDSIEVAEGLRPDEWIALNISDEITDGEQVHPVRLESSSSSSGQAPPSTLAASPTTMPPLNGKAPAQKAALAAPVSE